MRQRVAIYLAVMLLLAFIGPRTFACCKNPVASFSGPSSVYCGDQAIFTCTSTDQDSSISSRSWSAPGGSPATGNGSSFTTKWCTTGSKTVSLTVWDSDASVGCPPNKSDTEHKNVTVQAVEIVSLEANKNPACINEDIDFTVTTSPSGKYTCLQWSGGGTTNPSQEGGSTFTTKWSTAGTKTVTVSGCGSSKSKQVEIISDLTVMPREAYVCVTCSKYFYAYACGGSAQDVTAQSTFSTSNGSFSGNTLTASSTPSTSEGTDWVRATYQDNTTDAAHDCDLIVFDVEITGVTPPNDGVSFTTLAGEKGIQCQADIKPDSLDSTYNSQIEWEIEDNPGVTGDSGDPADPEMGNNVTLTVTAPAAPSGRSFKLNYRIQASLTIDVGTCDSAWETIIQDDKDQLRQQYVDTGYSPIPARTAAALKNSSTYVNPGNLTFSEVQCNGDNCGNHAYLLDNTISSVFQDVRDELGSAITVTSAYRCPIWNIHEGGVTNSKHTQGDAFDFDNGDAAQNWPVAQAAKAAGVATTKILLYPQNGGGSYKTLSWLESNGYNDTNLPPGWTTYRFGHITTN